MVAHAAPSFAAGDAAHGAAVYRQCNVFGRTAGTVANYSYSVALKASNIVWNEATLDQWLTNPQALVPGTKMMFSVDNAQDRADVIAFLKDKAGSDVSSAAPAEK